MIVGGWRSLTGFSQFDTKSCSRAYGLLESLSRSSFIIALASAKKVMGLTISLSQMLQSINLDYAEATQDITEIKETLMHWRTNDEEWNGNAFSVYKQAEDLARCLDVPLSTPVLHIGNSIDHPTTKPHQQKNISKDAFGILI